MSTPTTTARKTTAAKKAAPAKAPAKAAPATTTPKLRWQVEGGDRSQVGKVAQSATVGDREYRIDRSGDAWKATMQGGPQDHHVGGGHVREGVCRDPGTPQERIARPDRPVTAGRSA